jgi:NAD(P)H-hydrate epimerase
VLSLDVPTGIDSTKGNIYNKCIRADYTMTLALPKQGLLKENARSYIGSLYLADIGIPGALYKELGLDIEDIFQHENIIKLPGN